jgi:uncharacterized cupin superfamily protein
VIAKVARDVEASSVSGYPAEFRERVLPRQVRRLGEVFGLTQIGVNLVTMNPGKESSLRHHHTHEDELVYMLGGELWLRTDQGEELLRPGMVVGFRAGDGNGHHLVNRSTQTATFLAMSNRHPEDGADYSDEDLMVRKGPDGKYRYTKKNGAPVSDP